MDYEEFVRNIRKTGLTIKEFANLIKTNPNSITNLSTKEKMPKNLAIIAVLLGEIADKGIEYKYLFEKMDLQPQKARNKEAFRNMSNFDQRRLERRKSMTINKVSLHSKEHHSFHVGVDGDTLSKLVFDMSMKEYGISDLQRLDKTKVKIIKLKDK